VSPDIWNVLQGGDWEPCIFYDIIPIPYSVVLRADQDSISGSPDARYQLKNKKIQKRDSTKKEWMRTRNSIKSRNKAYEQQQGEEEIPRSATREPCYFIEEKRYWDALVYLTQDSANESSMLKGTNQGIYKASSGVHR
jgi:hypothetical protein